MEIFVIKNGVYMCLVFWKKKFVMQGGFCGDHSKFILFINQIF